MAMDLMTLMILMISTELKMKVDKREKGNGEDGFSANKILQQNFYQNWRFVTQWERYLAFAGTWKPLKNLCNFRKEVE